MRAGQKAHYWSDPGYKDTRPGKVTTRINTSVGRFPGKNRRERRAFAHAMQKRWLAAKRAGRLPEVPGT